MSLAAAALALALAAAEPAESPVLASFDFDGDEVETGPYTVIAYEHARGTVNLTTRFRHSGTRSVEITDVAGDGEFAELQGFFREMPSGTVHVHFAFMLAEPGEAMNIATAGAGHFAMARNGFGFWLKNRGGVLHHVTGGRDVPLFRPAAFTWYVADVAYDVDQGRYDLRIVAEGRPGPVVFLRAVPNPMGLKRSRIHKFSFIGDPPGQDGSNARFYVDDIVVRADHAVPAEGPFVAPGRRMLFVDVYRYYRSLLYEKPGCLPALGPEDFGLSGFDMHALAEAGRLRLYDGLADRRVADAPQGIDGEPGQRLEAMAAWGRGCAAACRGSCALPHFLKAESLAPGAKMYPMSRVLALAAEKRWEEADALFAASYPDWRGDPRFPAVSALLGVARGDLDEAERSLATASDSDPSPAGHPVLRRLWAGEPGPGPGPRSPGRVPRHVGRPSRIGPRRGAPLLRPALAGELPAGPRGRGPHGRKAARHGASPGCVAGTPRRRALLARRRPRGPGELRGGPRRPRGPRSCLCEALRRPLRPGRSRGRAAFPREGLRQPEAIGRPLRTRRPPRLRGHPRGVRVPW